LRPTPATVPVGLTPSEPPAGQSVLACTCAVAPKSKPLTNKGANTQAFLLTTPLF
jgi:hypothetical protein